MAEVSGSPFSRNSTGKPSASRYSLGRGVLWWSELDASDDPDGDGWVHLGNAPAFSTSLTRNFLDHFTSLSGLRDRDARIVIESLFDLRFQLDELTEMVAALFFSADPESYTNAAIAGFAEREMIEAVEWGRSYEISDGTNRAHGVRAADLTVELQGATQVVAAADRTIAFVAATDKIVASSGDFGADGYRVGRNVVVTGTASNDGTYPITAVSALEITVGGALTDEAAASSAATLNSPDVVLVEGTDYELGSAEGEIFFLTTSAYASANDGVPIDVTLAARAGADTMRRIPVQSRGEVTGALKFYGENPRDERKFLLYIPKVTINPDGELSLITAQELTVIPFTGAAVKKDTNTAIAYLYALPDEAE
jgi:hypothetical protein